MSSGEKNDDVIAPAAAHSSTSSIREEKVGYVDDGEIFKRGEGIEDFRTVSWVQTTVILLKCKSSLYLCYGRGFEYTILTIPQ